MPKPTILPPVVLLVLNQASMLKTFGPATPLAVPALPVVAPLKLSARSVSLSSAPAAPVGDSGALHEIVESRPVACSRA